MRLPDRYSSMMKNLLEDYPAYRDSLSCPWERGIRVNPLKLRSREEALRVLEKAAGEEGEPEGIPWSPEGFYPPAGASFSAHPFYQAGLYYLQEPSAQAPAAELPVKPGDRVLDLCAAPGGKSTQLLAKLEGRGFLVANDPSAGRAAALRKNLELFGAANAFVTVEEPERLAKVWPEFFDAVLVDAPCSGSGMFRKEPQMTAVYEERGPGSYVGIQREILEQAVSMLRPGGYLMYSTCTFSPDEDEGQVLELLRRHPELSLMPLKGAEYYAPGIRESLSLCGRLYPHRLRGEGQFLALLRKEGGALPERGGRNALRGTSRLYEAGGLLHLLPEGSRPLPGIRYLMTGLCLAKRKGSRLQPTQALAMALGPGEWPGILQLSAEDERVLRYLRGETIFLEDFDVIRKGQAPGWLPEDLDLRNLLVTVEGYPLGFAREQKGMLKNLRDPGWRLL